MAIIDTLTWSSLTAADLDGAVALNAEAGWNQTAADWLFMLQQGEGMGVRQDGLIATSMLLPQGNRFAWIAMILVTARWQRRGLASELMRLCITHADELGLVAGLDATEAGRQVYLPLGFADIYPLTRWQVTRWQTDGAKATGGAGVRPMTTNDLDRVAAWDRDISGAPRNALLRHLHGRCPERAFILESGGNVRGFVLARNGRLASQIGPLSADDEAGAIALLQPAIAAALGPIFLDAADHHGNFQAVLADLGFTKQRGYMRMLRGRGRPLDDPSRVFLIAGPELG
ncbi:MAG: GNAT family N-acetyltransferase [Alphaproteobacteria bacterium]